MVGQVPAVQPDAFDGDAPLLQARRERDHFTGRRLRVVRVEEEHDMIRLRQGEMLERLHLVLVRLNERVGDREHTSELQSQSNLVCRLLLEKKKKLAKYIYCDR